MKTIKVVFLGTNGWFDTKTGNTICILIECSDYYIVLDAGIGFSKLDRYINGNKPVYLFLSHFHLDHIYGLHSLAKFKFERGFNIIGQKGTENILNTYLSSPFTIALKDLNFKTKIIEVPDELGELPFKAKVLPMVHASPTIGIRLEIGGKVITYCPDTGYCKNAVELSKNADLLITECAYTVDFVTEGWPHLNPETAARIAVEAEAKKLVLTHFDAEIYKTLEARKEAGIISRKIFPRTYISRDDMEIEV